jgi:hypothetical protein
MCFGVMTRHFEKGFITDVVSKGILTLGSYVFSLIFFVSAWAWIDGEYNFKSFPKPDEEFEETAKTLFYVFFIFACIMNRYPILGMFFLIFVDMLLRMILKDYVEYWVAPLAATLVACIAHLFFDYVAGIILDTIDVCFVTWAVDKDNKVDVSKSDFSSIILALPGHKVANPNGDASAALLVASGGAPAPVQNGEFMQPSAQPVQGTIQPFGEPGAQPMIMQAGAQPVVMMQSPQGGAVQMVPMGQHVQQP